MHAVQKSILILQCHEISHQVKKNVLLRSISFSQLHFDTYRIGCFALYDTSILFVTHTDVQYFLEDLRKNQNLYVFWKDNKFPVKVIGYFIAEISGCFTLMVAIVRIRFRLNGADIKVGLKMSNVINNSIRILIRPMALFLCYGSGFSKYMFNVDPVGLTLKRCGTLLAELNLQDSDL